MDAAGWATSTSWTRPTSEKLKPPSPLSFSTISGFFLLLVFRFPPPLCFHLILPLPGPCGHLFDLTYFPFYALRAAIVGVYSVQSTSNSTNHRPPGRIIFYFWKTLSGPCEWDSLNGSQCGSWFPTPHPTENTPTATFPWLPPRSQCHFYNHLPIQTPKTTNHPRTACL